MYYYPVSCFCVSAIVLIIQLYILYLVKTTVLLNVLKSNGNNNMITIVSLGLEICLRYNNQI